MSTTANYDEVAKPRRFYEMSIDELWQLRLDAWKRNSSGIADGISAHLSMRLAVKYALLDLSEDLSEQGLVVVSELDFQARYVAAVDWAKSLDFSAAPSPGETGNG